MMKKTLKKLSTLFLAFALVGLLLIPGAEGVIGAEGDTNSNPVTITQKINVSEGSGAPVGQISYELIEDKPTASPATYSVNFDGSETVNGGVASKTFDIDFSRFNYTTPGVYKYELSQTEAAIDGVSVVNTPLTIDIYVVNGTGGLAIDGCVVQNKTSGDKNAGEFINDYNTKSVTVSKTVTGNQADLNKTFEFNLTVNGTKGERYSVVTATATQQITADEQGQAQAQINLSNGQNVSIKGLSPADTFSVSEGNYEADGYAASYAINGGDSVNSRATETITMGNTDQTVAFTNDKNTTTPTGIILSIAPYMVIVLVAIGLGFVFMRKRRRSFED